MISIGWIYFVIKARQWNFFDFISSYSMVFTLASIPSVSYTFIIQQNVFIFVMTYCCNNTFIHAFCFFMFTIVVYEE